MRLVNQRTGVWKTHLSLVLLVGVISVIFFLQWVLGSTWDVRFMAVPAEVIKGSKELMAGNFSSSALLSVLTLSTCEFLHASAEHLLFNMIFLWMFGALALELLGARWMILIFLVTGFFGSVCHVALNAGDSIPMLGASGGVMGFQGAYLAMAMRWHMPNPHVWPISRPVPPANLAIFAIVGIVGDYSGLMDHGSQGVAYGAHIGGFISGVFITGFMAPRPEGARPR